MDWNVLNGVIRATAPAAIAYAAGRGWITADQGNEIVAAICTCGAAIWSVKSNWKGPAK